MVTRSRGRPQQPDRTRRDVSVDLAEHDIRQRARKHRPTSFAFAGTTADATLSATTNELRMLTPYEGWLQSVTVFGTVGTGDGIVGFHKNSNNTPTASKTFPVVATAAARFDFGTDASFVRGDRVSVSYDPPGAGSPGETNVACEWVVRRNA